MGYSIWLVDSAKGHGIPCRSLLKAEKAMAKQLNTTLTKFAGSIQSAVNEFKDMDTKGSRAVQQGGTQSRKNIHEKQSK